MLASELWENGFLLFLSHICCNLLHLPQETNIGGLDGLDTQGPSLCEFIKLYVMYAVFYVYGALQLKLKKRGASLVVQWLSIDLAMQETRVWSLVGEDPTGWGASPSCHKYCAQELKLLKPACPRACTPPQEKSLQWEANSPQLGKA